MTKTWPAGDTMTTSCPWSNSLNVVDVAVCKEVEADCRHVKCDCCFEDYELRETCETCETGKLKLRRGAAGFLEHYVVE